MSPSTDDRRHRQRRWRERRIENHPVLLDTRLPRERRASERREHQTPARH